MRNSNESLQNKFTAYLVTAVDNAVKSYFEHGNCSKKVEQGYLFHFVEETFTEFDTQWFGYLKDQEMEYAKSWESLYKILSLIENKKLLNKIKKLKQEEQLILMARIFGRFSFEEIGTKFNLRAKQVEMSYYYVLRKLRKELKKDEF